MNGTEPMTPLWVPVSRYVRSLTFTVNHRIPSVTYAPNTKSVQNQLHSPDYVHCRRSTTNSLSMMSANPYFSCEINKVAFSIFLPLSISLSCSLPLMDIFCKPILICSVDSQYDNVHFSNSPQLYKCVEITHSAQN